MLGDIPLEELKLYLYSSVLLPLKNLGIDFPTIPSPIHDNDGQSWYMEVEYEPMTERTRHNYQRDRQQRIRNYLVILRHEGSYERFPVAYYHREHKWVKLYQYPFKSLGASRLLEQMYSIFSETTPFTAVKYDHKRAGYDKIMRRIMRTSGHLRDYEPF